MIATITQPTPKGQPAPKPCMVLFTGKGGFISIKIDTYCKVEVDADQGVYQIPDIALEKGYICERCVANYRAYEAKFK